MKAATAPHSLIAKKVMVRKKIWDIAGGYKCSLIGICLGSAELRKLGKEKVFDIRRDADDYYLHCAFIRISDQRGEKGRAFQQYLEKKFKAKSRKYLKATTDEDLQALWDADMAQGQADIAWWGILTHPEASAELVNRLYGNIHMQAHHCFRNGFRDQSRIADLQGKVTSLTDTLMQERQSHRQLKREWESEKQGLKRELTALDAFRRKHEKDASSGQKTKIPPVLIPNIKPDMKPDMNMDLNAVPVQTPQDQARWDHLQNQIRALQTQLREAHLQLEAQAEQEKKDRAEQEKLSLEISALEKMIFRSASDGDPCDTCASQNTGNCPGLDLCGKTVLYVGGHHKMVARYRQLVEQCGGRFMHHDGGKETSRNLLPKMLLTADAVVCPIDCISHDACTRAKKMCKQYQKPFVPMRTSGISALARGLDEILQ